MIDRTSPEALSAWATVRATGSHADCVPGRSTYELRVLDSAGRITVLVGLRFDDPSDAIRRALAVLVGS